MAEELMMTRAQWESLRGQELAMRRTRVESTCLECGAPMTGINTKRFCGARCRVSWNRKQKAAAV